MAVVNPILIDSVAPTNIRHKIINDIVTPLYKAKFGSSVKYYGRGIVHINSIPNFPALLFSSGSESLLGEDINTKKDFEFVIRIQGYVRHENPDTLEEQMDNFVHAVKKVAYVERDNKFGDTTGLIIDVIPGDVSVITEFLPFGFAGFTMDLGIRYRVFLPNV